MSDLFKHGGAVFSPCRLYRYHLWRRWDHDRSAVNFIMLNPSTADASNNDPTVERCERRAVQMGYGKLIVTNLFAFRSTDPAILNKLDDPVGLENDAAIIEAASEAALVICAWGNHGGILNRSAQVLAILRSRTELATKLRCLKIAKTGQPYHPLYLPYDLQPIPFAACTAAPAG